MHNMCEHICDHFEQKQAYGLVWVAAEVCSIYTCIKLHQAHFPWRLHPSTCLLLLEAVTYDVNVMLSSFKKKANISWHKNRGYNLLTGELTSCISFSNSGLCPDHKAVSHWWCWGVGTSTPHW